MKNHPLNPLFTKAANLAAAAVSAPGYYAFLKACGNVRKAQEQLLSEIIKTNAGTKFGMRHNFWKIKSRADFQSAVPLTEYEDYAEYINDIAEGRIGALTAEKVSIFAPTSGSAASTKYIPYTAGLKRRFRRAISAWLFDLLANHSGIAAGKAYWQITPAAEGAKHKLGVVPAGFENDAEYLGAITKLFNRLTMAVPAEVSRITDIDNFRYVTLLFLLKTDNLSFISVWNPTFLPLLLSPLENWAGQLAKDIAQGSITAPKPLPDEIQTALLAQNAPDKSRAKFIKKIFNEKDRSFSRIWPELKIISCWGDANSAPYLPELARLFPGAKIQKKGLIATEAFVSLPLKAAGEACALAANSHFFEFIPVDGAQSAEPLLAWELEAGKSYSVAVTNGAGLYRYRLHDIVEVTGFYKQAPLIKFAGKEDLISDILGEKINAVHAGRVIASLFNSGTPSFCLLAPEKDSAGYFYCLYAQLPQSRQLPPEPRALADGLEAGLADNFHYSYCRKLGQLKKARVFIIDAGSRPAEDYINACRAGGQKIGGVKNQVLNKNTGWSAVFSGRYLAE